MTSHFKKKSSFKKMSSFSEKIYKKKMLECSLATEKQFEEQKTYKTETQNEHDKLQKRPKMASLSFGFSPKKLVNRQKKFATDKKR